MPVVLSYNDIGALGALAYESGNAAYRQGQQARTDQLAMQRRDQDTQRMQIEAQRQQSERDRQLQAQLAGREMSQSQQQFDARLGYQYDALAADQQALAARLAESRESALINAQGRLANTMMSAQQRAALSAQQHQQELAEIEAGGTRAADGQAISPAGMPSKQRMNTEIRQYGNLIPWDTAEAINSRDAARRQEESREAAEAYLSQPTDQLKQIIQQKPQSKWSPFLRAVIQSREALQGSGQQRRAMPEGPAGPGAFQGVPPEGGSNLGGGQRSARNRFNDLSQAELDALASDPELLQRYYNGEIDFQEGE